MLKENGIELDELYLTYDNNVIFNNFSLSVQTKQWVGILGASGIGKSTLLKAIAGLISPELMNITCQGEIAYMAQSDLLFPWLSVIENILIGYRLRGDLISPALKKETLDLIEKVGLSHVQDLFPPALSGGMKQRVVLARTLIEKKGIILMDEPFSALDAITRIKMQSLSAQLLKDKTVLFITHDPLEALRLADVIYVMQGSPATLSKPLVMQGDKPRNFNDSVLLSLQAQLLDQLGAQA